MDLDHIPAVIKQHPIAHVQDRQEVDEAEDVDGDDEQYDQPEEPKRTKKTRKELNDDVPFNRALPVAELPDDFDGEALDGATFLALAK
jgi:predicted 2-oxoglutarate/Fe(II)-dependent dioxygenase YbiX